MLKVLSSLGILAALTLVVTPAHAQKGTLTVWINSDKAHGGLAEVGKRFEKATGVKVVVEHSQDTAGKFQQWAAANKGVANGCTPGLCPDIVIWSHERTNEWVAAGLVAEVSPTPKFKGQFEKIGWDAFTVGGKVWGYPLSVEAIGLIYNKALIKSPPKTFEEMFALHKQLSKNGQRAILYAYDAPYFSFPLLAANGGYAFGRNDKGDYVVTDVGVNNAGAVKGAEMLARLLTEGVMPKGAGYSQMEAAMFKGELAMMISGPWAWAGLKKAKIDFGVWSLPSIDGKPAKPFVGVQGAMINRASAGKQRAVEFIESYMLTLDGLKAMDADVPLGVTPHKEFYKARSSDPRVKATMANVKAGVMIPGVPEMSRFWSAMGAAFSNISTGRQKPKDALDTAAARIKTP